MLRVLTPISHVNAETAGAVCQRVCAVLEWDIAIELRNDFLCDGVVPVLDHKQDIVQQIRALPTRMRRRPSRRSGHRGRLRSPWLPGDYNYHHRP